MEQGVRHRRAAVRQHADGRAVDEAGGAGEGVLDASGAADRLAIPELGDKLVGLGGVGVEYADFGDVEAGQREGDGLADAAGADHGHRVLLRAGDEILRCSGEAGRIGVVAGQPAAAHHDGVHRADGAGAGREVVEQIDHGFLVGEGDIDAGKAELAHAIEDAAQLVAIRAGDLDELIVAARPHRLGCALMHRRRRRMRDRCAEQAGEEAGGRD